MNNVVLLTRLEIMQVLGGLKAAIAKNTGMNGTVSIIGSAVLALAMLGGLGWVGSFAYGIIGTMGLAKPVYNTLFLVAGMLTFVISLPTVLSAFFGSSDVSNLLPLPVTPLSIVFSKALGVLAASYMWTAVCIAGPLAGWGIAAGAPLQYWITYIAAVIFTPMMPTAYAGILSIVIATVFKRARRKDSITTIATVGTLALCLAFYLVFDGLQKTGLANAIGNIAELMGGAVMAFPAYGFAVYALQHNDPLGIVLFILISLASFALFVLVARVLYMRIATTLSGGGGKSVAYHAAEQTKESSVLSTLMRAEVKKIVRTSSILLNFVVYPAVISPAITIATLGSGSLADLLQQIAEKSDIDVMFSGFALTGLMFFVTLDVSMNMLAATGISREGSNWPYMKYLPIPLFTQLLAKALVSFVVSALITALVMGFGLFFIVTRGGISIVIAASGFLLMMAASWLMACVSLWYDTRRPRVEWGNDGDATTKSVGGTGGMLRSMLVGVLYTLVPLLATPLVGLDPRIFMPVFALVGIALSILLGRLLLTAGARNMEAFE